MLQARIRLIYSDQVTAAAVARSIIPDNASVPAGLSIFTYRKDNMVNTEIKLEGKFATFIATIDDLLEAAATAEKSLHVVKSS